MFMGDSKVLRNKTLRQHEMLRQKQDDERKQLRGEQHLLKKRGSSVNIKA
jgi:hypothetical protein